MPYRLSLIERAPVHEGQVPAMVLAKTVALAQRAEALGYHRIWFGEHHGLAGLASSAPEILAAFVLARTRNIRVGAGGVMLRHYAPYKIAETFNLLAALAPDRVDLGVNRGPAGLPLSNRALRSGRVEEMTRPFAEKLAELDSYVHSAPDFADSGLRPVATPAPPVPPDRILLGASAETAELAARQGWRFCYAGDFAGDPDQIVRVFDHYRRQTDQPALLMVNAFVAATADAASALVRPLRQFRLRLGNGQTASLPSHAAAREFARQMKIADPHIEPVPLQTLSGSASEVHDRLEDLHDRFGIDEFVVDTPAVAASDRLASIQALAAPAGMKLQTAAA